MQISPASIHPLQNLSLSVEKKLLPCWKTYIYELFKRIQNGFYYCLSCVRMPKVCIPVAAKIQEKVCRAAAFLIPCKFRNQLPRDSAITVKKLDNGLTYYVRKNNYPFPQKAYLRLVVRVGMLNETSAERGIAHLIEHITQIETANFSKDKILNYLNSKGVHWARDNNAFTTPEETVYKVDIPLKDPETLEQCLIILSEVASKATLSDDIINNEREIVIDELSHSRGPWQRYSDSKYCIIYEDTPYAILKKRDEEIKNVKECPPQTVQAFYKRWYQPENMAVIAVGDFDSKKTGALIEKHFGKMPKSDFPPSMHNYQLKANPGTRFLCVSDPEITHSAVEILHQLPKIKYSNELQALRMSLAINIFKYIVNERLENLIEEEDSPFIEVRCSSDDLLPNHPSFKLQVIAKEGKIPQAFRQLLLEGKRIKSHGFLQSEFDRIKKSYLASIDHTIQEKNKISSSSFIEVCHSHFLEGTAIADIEKSLYIKKQLIEKLTLKDVNTLASYLIPETNRFISTAAPEKVGLENVKEDILKQEINFVAKENIKQLTDEYIDQPLMKTLPKPGKIESIKVYKKSNVTEYNLKNGMRVFFKPTNFKNNEISLKAYSIDGTRDAQINTLASAKFCNDFFEACGIGDFDNKTLAKVLHGKIFKFSTSVGNYMTTIKAASVLKDLETVFQLFHLMFTKPGYDRAAFNRALKYSEENFRNDLKNPSKVFSREITATTTNNHPEFKPLGFEDLKSIDYDTCKDFHQKKFSNSANFTVAIVGNIQTKKIKSLVERYFASLPKTGEKRAVFNYSPTLFPPGITRKIVRCGKETSGTSIINFPSPINDSLKERLLSIWCCEILEMRLTKVLRFDSGKTYSQSCKFSNTCMPGLNPNNASRALVVLTGDPKMHETLEKGLIEQIQDLQTNGPTEDEVKDFKTSMSKLYSEDMKVNSGWIDTILTSSIWNREQDNFDAHEKELELLTPEAAKEQFKKIFHIDNYAAFTLLPQIEEIATI